MTDASIGWGAEFHMDNATGVLTELEEITGITPPAPETDDVEATHFKSANRKREYIAGLIEDGTGDFETNYVAGSPTDVLLRAAQKDGKARDYKIVIPAGDATWEVSGQLIVKKYARSIPIDGVQKATLTVRFTGDTTEAAGA